MALESGSFIADLVTTNPDGTDNRIFGDDHLRLIKKVIKQSFPTITGAVNITHTEFNYADGLTGDVQSQIDSKLTLFSTVFSASMVLPPAADTSTSVTADTTVVSRMYVSASDASVNAIPYTNSFSRSESAIYYAHYNWNAVGTITLSMWNNCASTKTVSVVLKGWV